MRPTVGKNADDLSQGGRIHDPLRRASGLWASSAPRTPRAAVVAQWLINGYNCGRSSVSNHLYGVLGEYDLISTERELRLPQNLSLSNRSIKFDPICELIHSSPQRHRRRSGPGALFSTRANGARRIGTQINHVLTDRSCAICLTPAPRNTREGSRRIRGLPASPSANASVFYVSTVE